MGNPTSAAQGVDGSKMAEIIAKMDARDEARDEQIRTKDRHVGELIDKLTTMSAAGEDDSYNKDRNKKRVRPGRGKGRGGRGGEGRGGGGRGDGGRGGRGRGNGTTSGSGRPAPAYSQKCKAADGGGARIDHKTVEFSNKWDYVHQGAWRRSKMYDDDYAKWKARETKHKAWKAAGSNGQLRDFEEVKQELTVAQKKAALQAQIDALG